MEALERLTPVLILVLAVVGGLIAFAIKTGADNTENLADETAKRACIEAAVAKYPAVSVSAFVTRDRSASGPLKLSFVRERQKAVAACE
jgi:hypothetical protein